MYEGHEVLSYLMRSEHTGHGLHAREEESNPLGTFCRVGYASKVAPLCQQCICCLSVIAFIQDASFLCQL